MNRTSLPWYARSAHRWPRTASGGVVLEGDHAKALVVAEVEPQLLERPFEIPVGLRDEEEVRCRLLTAEITSTQSLSAGAGPARGPQVRSNTSFIGEHRHVATHAVALARDVERVSITASRRPGWKTFSCSTSGRGREVGISAAGKPPPVRSARTTPDRSARRPPAHGRNTRVPHDPRMVGARRGSGRSRA